jgi:tetratricopeptide (TPR) repeat protein
MRTYARVLVLSGVVLALGVCLLAVVPARSAADKPMVWKPLVPGDSVNPTVKEIITSLQEALQKGPEKADNPKEQMENNAEWELKLSNGALLIALLTQSTKEGTTDPQLATLRAAAVELYKAFDKKEMDKAKKQLDALANLKPDAKADVQPVAIDDMADIMLMNLMKLRSRGGLGLGPKPGEISPDGIEAKLLSLTKRPLPKDVLAKEAEALEQAGYIMAAISQMAEAKTPAKKMEDKDPADWKQYTVEMREGALEFAAAAKAKDANKLKEVATKLNASCTTCHKKFRE